MSRPISPARSRARRAAACPPALLLGAALAAVWAPAGEARAQYKNVSFGFDGAYEGIIRPGIKNSAGNIIGTVNDGTSPSNFPLRLSVGGRIGLETNLKLHSDHWWASFRLNFHFLSVGESGSDPDTQAYDRAAGPGIGTALGLQPVVGVRYYLFTDRVRPFFQPSIMFMRLFNFNDARSCNVYTNAAGQVNAAGNFCGTNGQSLDTYLSHQNILSLQVTPGIEFIVHRDLALTFACGIEHWFIFNAQDNWSFTPSIGLTIYG